MKMKSALVSILLLVFLSGCTNSKAKPEVYPESQVIKKWRSHSGDTDYFRLEIENKTLDCVYHDAYNAGGLSCNWEGYNKDLK